MTVPEIISRPGKHFSIEVLPPLKGRGLAGMLDRLAPVIEMGPGYINITTHRSEQVYRSTPDGLYQRVYERSRPGTVAVAAAMQHRFGIPAVPHMICSGFSKTETEYALIDLSFLGITNLLLLRGDKARHHSRFTPEQGGHAHASELQMQVNEFNAGRFVDGSEMDLVADAPFSYGVAGYPEKHEESPNRELDLMWLKHKVDCGAQYIVTQMVFDNERFYRFVDDCRAAGINVPIIPGIKPVTTCAQLTVLPRVFHVDLPDALARELMACRDDAAAKEVGVEWAAGQLKDLYAHGIPSVHLYSLNAVPSVERILRQVL